MDKVKYNESDYHEWYNCYVEDCDASGDIPLSFEEWKDNYLEETLYILNLNNINDI